MGSKLFTVDDYPTGLFLNNAWIPGEGEPLRFTSSADGELLDIPPLHTATVSDIDKAVSYAQAAFTGEWSTYSGEKRGILLHKLADLIMEHAEELAYFESRCSGIPVSFVRRGIPSMASVFRYYAGWADKYKGDYFPPTDGFYKIVEHEPIGVCAGITAWNASLLFLAWKSAPALATGNTIIIKPSEKSPLGTLAVGYLVSKAGFPPGVLQIVVGEGLTGHLLSSHMKIAKVSFTGSTTTGRKIQDAATKSNLKRVTLELGGKSPGVVFDDADMQKTLFWCTFGITGNTGQVCAATSRLFVQETIAEQFVNSLKQSFQAIAEGMGGDPLNPATTYGPVIDKIQYDRVSEFIETAKHDLAPAVGGEVYSGKGYYIPPTIFLNPPEDANIYREEVFGPVLCIKTFKTEAEAIQLANDTDYGLAGSVYTQDLKRALRVSRAIRAGTVGVNCASVVGPQVPMGGFKLSGVGREMGEYALRHYTEPKSIWISAA
ncbi:aldehyde dehydrogenase domain-containing protein [Aspergillus californicus]